MIEVNGITYIEKKQSSGGYLSPRLRALFMMTLAFGSLSYGMGLKQKERPEVNIIEEFGLIELKKSNLSKNNRDWVVRQFNSRFEVAECGINIIENKSK